MTDDFELFPERSLGDPVDCDIGLVVAYLAGELTPVQNRAIEERLATDAEFREHVWPVMEAWLHPGSFGRVEIPKARTRAARSAALLKAAAIVGVVLLPLATLAQFVVYSAARAEAPGHAMARRIVDKLTPGPDRPEPQVPAPTAPAHVTQPRPAAAAKDPIPPVRDIGAQLAISVDSFVAWPDIAVRGFADGRAIVVDRVRQQARLYDATLARAADIRVPDERWRTRIGVSPFRGDSTILLSTFAMALGAVVDPGGRVVRTIPWREASLAVPIAAGMAVVTGAGDIVSVIPRDLKRSPEGIWYRPQGAPANSGAADSLIVVRARLGESTVDTVGFVMRPASARLPSGFGKFVDVMGRGVPVGGIAAVDAADAMVAFPDGSIAIVRSSDYHIDFVDADGTRRSTPPIPHDKHRPTEAEKRELIEDALELRARFPIGVRLLHGQEVRPDRVYTTLTLDTVPDVLPPFLFRGRPIPYRPVTDAEGRLWIPKFPAPGSGGAPAVVFDVVDRRGKLVDRVRMPADAVPVAFAPGLVFAMQWGDPPGHCPRPAPGVDAVAGPECTVNLARLASYRVR